MKFSDRVAIVTGGASGIGRDVARRLAAEGAAVAVADLNADGAATVAAELQDGGAEALAITLDVAKPEDNQRMVAETLARFDRLDILVHSAGVGVERSFLETTPEEWCRLIDIDLSGTFYCCQAAAREMVKARYGRIVNISSTAAIRGGGGRAAYGAAKGGVITLTKVIATELAAQGVTANALAPGAIDTELAQKMHSAKTRAVYTAAIPMDRYGTPVETASAAVYLASEEACYITGVVLAVDGGFLSAGLMPWKAD